MSLDGRLLAIGKLYGAISIYGLSGGRLLRMLEDHCDTINDYQASAVRARQSQLRNRAARLRHHVDRQLRDRHHS
jgi:hypothetical protein